MSHITTSQLAELARLTKRQVQRILDRGTPDLGATRDSGGHWIIPDSPALRKWARHHKRWKRTVGSVKRNNLNANDKSTGIITIEGISQNFAMWHRKVSGLIPRWDETRLDRAIALLDQQAKVHAELVAMRDQLRKPKTHKTGSVPTARSRASS